MITQNTFRKCPCGFLAFGRSKRKAKSAEVGILALLLEEGIGENSNWSGRHSKAELSLSPTSKSWKWGQEMGSGYGNKILRETSQGYHTSALIYDPGKIKVLIQNFRNKGSEIAVRFQGFIPASPRPPSLRLSFILPSLEPRHSFSCSGCRNQRIQSAARSPGPESLEGWVP